MRITRVLPMTRKSTMDEVFDAFSHMEDGGRYFFHNQEGWVYKKDYWVVDVAREKLRKLGYFCEIVDGGFSDLETKETFVSYFLIYKRS